jgi:hypothetical protein
MTATAKKTGLIFGGFKPFTTGHYSRCLQSLATCDQTILVYSTKPRGENDQEIPESALERMWEVITPALEAKGIVVRKALTTPVKDVFGFIGAIRTRLDNPSSTSYDVFCKYFSLHPASSGLALFGSYEDIYDNFGKHVGKPSEKRFFGSLLQEKKIVFITDPAVSLLEKEVGKASAEDLTRIRATHVRKLLREDVDKAASYLFPMNHDSRRQVLASLGFKKD